MQRILTLCLLFLSTLPTYAQNDPKTDAPDLEVVNVSWRGSNLAINQREGAFSIDVKNTGRKAIKAVNWRFYLIDSVRQQVYDMFKFRTDDKPLKPGEKKRFTKRFDYHNPPNYVRGVGQIMKVEYEDGSVWERPDDDKK